jgi:hypothetical protein
MGIMGKNFIYTPKQGVTAFPLDFHKTGYDDNFLVNVFWTEFRGNPTRVLVADTKSRTDGRGLHKRRFVLIALRTLEIRRCDWWTVM